MEECNNVEKRGIKGKGKKKREASKENAFFEGYERPKALSQAWARAPVKYSLQLRPYTRRTPGGQPASDGAGTTVDPFCWVLAPSHRVVGTTTVYLGY